MLKIKPSNKYFKYGFSIMSLFWKHNRLGKLGILENYATFKAKFSHKHYCFQSSAVFFTIYNILLWHVPVSKVFQDFFRQGKSLHLIGWNGESQGNPAQMLKALNEMRNSPEFYMSISAPTIKYKELLNIYSHIQAEEKSRVNTVSRNWISMMFQHDNVTWNTL